MITMVITIPEANIVKGDGGVGGGRVKLEVKGHCDHYNQDLSALEGAKRIYQKPSGEKQVFLGSQGIKQIFKNSNQ